MSDFPWKNGLAVARNSPEGMDYYAERKAGSSQLGDNGAVSGGIEESMGVDPMDKLLAELSATEKEWAEGAALFGAGGFAGDVRKKILSVVMLRIRDEILTKGEKAPTEKVLDAMAHADKDYVAWLDRQVVKRAEWLSLDAQREAILLRANRGQALLRVASRFA